MSLSPAILDAMLAAGCTAEQLAAVVKADLAADEARREAKRANNRERQARFQAKRKAENKAGTNADNALAPLATVSGPSPLDGPPNERNLTPPFIPQPLVVVEARADEIVAVFDEWNRIAKQTGMRTASKLTTERRSRARARLTEHGRDAFTEAIRRAAASAFCRGENDRGWKADFDFLLQPQSFLGLIEGKYDDRTPSRRSHPHEKPSGFAKWLSA